MEAQGVSYLIGQLTIVGLIIWLVFRVLRKAGYRRGRTWKWVCLSILGATLGAVGDDLFAVWSDLGRRVDNLTFGDLTILTLAHIVLSPYTLGIAPLLYGTFRKWPNEIQASDVDVFG